MSEYRVESAELSDINALEAVWLELQQRADCSFFQSWGWIGTWLSRIADELSPQVVTVYSGNQPVGLGIFISAEITRHHILRSRSMFLNEAPFNGNNMVIEYNGMLVARGHEPGVYAQTLQFLLRHFPTVDEFYFGAMSSVTELEASIKKCGYSVKYICQQASTSWSVILDDIGGSLEEYLATIGKNRRLQIKRSLRIYNEEALVQIDEAETVEQALSFFDGLKKLHTKRWHSCGKSGSFANTRWEIFHRALISSCFKQGEIQLLKVYNENGEIAYLYNFIWRKRVYVLQTGFVMSDDKRLMPGYVAHTLAIIYNKNKGMEIYDLMFGDDLYKKLLCNQKQKLYWSVVQRKKLRFALEDAAKFLLSKFK